MNLLPIEIQVNPQTFQTWESWCHLQQLTSWGWAGNSRFLNVWRKMGDQWKWIEMAIRSMWWISKQGLLTSASRLICYHSEVWLWSHAALCGFVLPDHDVRALPWWHSSLKRPFWTEKLDFSKKIRLIKKIRIKNRFTKKTTQQEESAEKQKRTTKTGNNPGVQLCCKLSTWILPSCCFGFCYFMLLFLVFVYSYFFWMAFCFIFFWLFFFSA